MSRLQRRQRSWSTATGLTVGGAAFFAVLMDGGRDLARTALGNGFYSGVYELQARALLDGSIALPDGSMGIEGFERGGQTFMYFPPFPALLRLPVLMTTDAFDGRLTVLSMALAWIVFAAMTAKLVWLVHDRVCETTETSRWGAALVAVFLASATGGTFLTYDASLPWVYHEVYLWAVAAGVGAAYWMIRVLLTPDWHSARWLGIFCAIAIGTRATEGWVMCLTAIGIGLWLRVRSPSGGRSRTWWAVMLAGTAPLVASITLNLYKFGHVYMFPLSDQVWTQVNERRREALAANGGDITGPQFFTTSFMAYFRPDGMRFTEHFPFITLPAEPAQAYSGAFVDQAYRTGSVTAFMPLLLLLTTVAVVALLGPWAPRPARVLRVPLLAGILVTGGVMAYGYHAARYASEFVPALVVGGAIGTVLWLRALSRRRWAHAPVVVAVAAITGFGILAQVAIGTSTAAYHKRGEELRRYLDWQAAATPAAQASLVVGIDGPPDPGDAPTDRLAIRGDCEAVYLASGDTYEPWITVEQRDQSLLLRPDGRIRAGRLVLWRSEVPRQEVVLEVRADNRLRVVLVDDEGRAGGRWTEFPPSGEIRIALRTLTDFGSFSVAFQPGGVVGYLRAMDADDDWITHPVDLDPVALTGVGAQTLPRDLGLRIEAGPVLDLPLCERLADRAGLDLDGP